MKTTSEEPRVLSAELRGLIEKREPLRRVMSLERAEVAAGDRAADGAESRTVDLAFSSELEYERYWGVEVLDHGDGAVDLSRLNDGAAVLVNHNTDDQVGVVERARIGDDRKGRASVRFGRGARATEIFNDVQDGIRRLVSVGYWIDEMKLAESREDGPDVYRVTKWTPFEISIVPVPADETVGVGRSADSISSENVSPGEKEDRPAIVKEDERMADEKAAPVVETPSAPPAPMVDVGAEREAAQRAERERVSELRKIRKKFNASEDLLDKAISEDMTPQGFGLAILEERGQAKPIKGDESDIGLTTREADDFQIMRLVRAEAEPGSLRMREAAAFEYDACRAAAQRAAELRRPINGRFVIPSDTLKRDLQVADDSYGGFLVQKQTGSFIELLQKKARVIEAGATVMSGLIGDVSFPEQTGAATAYWIGEGSDATESTQTFGEKNMAPKTIAATSDLTRKFLMQSTPDGERIVRSDLSTVLALGMDNKFLHGGGAAEPVGLASVSGIGSVAGGADGAKPDFADIVDLETQITQDDADIGTMSYMTNAKVAGYLKQTVEHATLPVAKWIWTTTGPGRGEMNGYPAIVTNQVSCTLEKGSSGEVASAIFFGNWASMVIGLWGGLDINIDTASLSKSGGVRLVAFQSCNSVVRQPKAFAAMLDALTA